MIKAVFFDIDWTLYDHEAKCFVPTAIEGIKKLKEKGIKVFICSARNTESIFSFGLYNLGISWDGFISSAGAFAVIGKDHVVRKTLMEHEDLVKLSSLVLKNDLTMQMVTPWSRFLIAPPNEFYKSYQEIFHDDCPTVHPYSNEEVTGTLLYAPTRYDDAFMKAFPNLSFFRFAECGVDINGGRHEKGEGIKAIRDELGLLKEECVSFGDDIQDISMADETGVFVCMGNGKEEVKKRATLVTSKVGENGVYLALVQLGLLP